MNALYLIATIAGQRVALRAGPIESVVDVGAVTPVPRVPPHIAGLAALRSRVLTIVDCRRSLGLGSGSGGRAVIVAVDAHHYGLLVDQVEDVVEIAAAPRAAPLALGSGWSRVACGMIEHDGAALLLVEPAALVAGPAAARNQRH